MLPCLNPHQRLRRCTQQAVYVNTVNVMRFTALLFDTNSGTNAYINIRLEFQRMKEIESEIPPFKDKRECLETRWGKCKTNPGAELLAVSPPSLFIIFSINTLQSQTQAAPFVVTFVSSVNNMADMIWYEMTPVCDSNWEYKGQCYEYKACQAHDYYSKKFLTDLIDFK